ncbi:MAG TPA: phosphoribulokinase [Methanoregulaceae archaeon]|nr:phosphoribulokinase [Methanoregulaceae archaeon]
MDIRNFRDIIAESPCVFVIGVAGDSGSGKTTFTSAIRRMFGDDLVSTVTLDDYHIYDRKTRKKLGITPLSPEANDLAGLERDIAVLKSGTSIEKKRYNHEAGIFEGPFTLHPTKIIIFEGLHTLFTPRLRGLMDFSLFVDPADEVKYEWKRKRDTDKRGYSDAEVNEEITQRASDYRTFIAPQMNFADAVIGIGYSVFGKELGQERNIYRVSLSQVPLEKQIREISLNIDLFSLLSMSDRDFILEYSVREIAGRNMGNLLFDGELPHDTVKRLLRGIEEQTSICPLAECDATEWVTAGEIVQLILAWRIINRRIFIEDDWKGTCGCETGQF